MIVRHIAAFSDGTTGGNPAGVAICKTLPTEFAMQQIAADVGFSETAFAEPRAGRWRVRYFSPETEVPFCGHATIALGAALAMDHGDGVFGLALNFRGNHGRGATSWGNVCRRTPVSADTKQARRSAISGKCTGIAWLC